MPEFDSEDSDPQPPIRPSGSGRGRQARGDPADPEYTGLELRRSRGVEIRVSRGSGTRLLCAALSWPPAGVRGSQAARHPRRPCGIATLRIGRSEHKKVTPRGGHDRNRWWEKRVTATPKAVGEMHPARTEIMLSTGRRTRCGQHLCSSSRPRQTSNGLEKQRSNIPTFGWQLTHISL